MSQLHNHLAAIAATPELGHLAGILRGLEKESLRTSSDGTLSQKPHNKTLGSALTHPEITTDFSEALLEFITPPHNNIPDLLEHLDRIHRFTYQSIDDELLWVNSMPCSIGSDANIPVAQYGSSNVAKMKTVYRLGLGNRYGRSMQTIAGVHYNFSFPDEFWIELQKIEKNADSLKDFKTQRYFDLIRNFRRYFWLLLYLFGAAPAVCSSFVKDKVHALKPLPHNDQTLHSPFATSLRMGDLGYQSNAQKSISARYNNLPDYLSALCGAITQPHPPYTALGIKDNHNNYQQLNDGILQIENEFYSPIRPKRTAASGETALRALNDRGVEYIEVRCIDLNPFEPVGISAEQIQFIDAFLLFCLLSKSKKASLKDCQQIQYNQQQIVYNGRDPKLQLLDKGSSRSFSEWSNELIDGIEKTAELLDKANNNSGTYQQTVSRQRTKLSDAEKTPSAQILNAIKDRQETFFEFSLKKSQEHAEHFRSRPLNDRQMADYHQMAKDSLVAQKDIESKDSVDFETYLKDFYAQYNYCSEQKKLV
ncbi:MAG: glutamate--cysteine ligase [Cellvibrionaceae bacterium]